MSPDPIRLTTDRMIAETEGAIGWITFNNPARHNAVSLEMWQTVPRIMDYFEQDVAVRVIVLRGAGDKAFVAGADISQFEEVRASAEAVAEYERISGEAGQRIAESPKPTIAMIHGYCIGGGVGLAADCDLRIASEGARFGVPAARLGLGYGMAGVKRLMDLVGPANTKEIFFTARHFSAAEAQAMGFVNRVLPEPELEPYVRSYCDMIAANAPLTINALKRTVAELARSSPSADAELVERLVRACFDSEDYVEGRRAFMEKRKPVFRGR
jgi:enoyl-CoA hydratase/carnithine racemase